jgi:phenylalanyl-tRNA synthetase alpha chain
MLEDLKKFIAEVDDFIPDHQQHLEEFRIKYLGKKGLIADLFDRFRDLGKDEKIKFGKMLNELKDAAQSKVTELQEKFKNLDQDKNISDLDLSLDPAPLKLGARHPVSIVKKQIIDIFSRMGFTLSEGPEIVDDWHNFSALNFPGDHPAKDMQDTFYIQKNPDWLLRTHTSPVQVQVMQSEPVPIRTISVGRVFRNETITYKSHVQFHQVEGLYVDKQVSFADLKQILFYFVQQMFGPDYKIRFRPSFFPFTEPSAEMDISPAKGDTKWMEILGCGMVDPKVLDNCGIDSNKYSGYAFGIGIERIALLKYKINDIRILYENDVRFLEQFISER